MTQPPPDPYGATPSPQEWDSESRPPARRFYELDADPVSPPPEQPFAPPPNPPGPPGPPNPPGPLKRSNGPIIIGICVAAVAVVCLAAAFFSVIPGSDGEESGEGVGDDSITAEFDPDNATFWNTYDGIAQEKRSLKDGRFYHESTEDNRHIKASGEPVYSDVDGDGDLDAAMTLQDTGGPGEDMGWSAVHIWLWEDDKVVPVAEHASWQWDCAGPSFDVFSGDDDEYFQITRNSYNDCGYTTGETITITVENETPVELSGEYRGATETCWVSENDEQYADLTNVSEPRVLPTPEAAALGDTAKQSKVEVSETDWDGESFGGYVTASVTWDDGERTCGWVPWEDYEGNS